MSKILILGGYGNFGGRIARALAKHRVPTIIAGRSESKARALAGELGADAAAFDVGTLLGARLDELKPKVVVNTAGPFQGANDDVAKACIARGVHYIDLADGRDFVVGISRLDAAARAASVAVISGASTVPGLSSAVLDACKGQFSHIDSLTFGIAPGQQAERGLATTKGIMSYVGKPLRPPRGSNQVRYGWQDLYRQEYPEFGRRWMANCDIPDLDLLPEAYGIGDIRFSAGMELGALHLGLWALSWLVRAGVPLDLPRHAALLLRASDLFNGIGSADGGMHMLIRGRGIDGGPHEVRWFILARNGDGPQIPTVPAIVLARKLYRDELDFRGARACLGMVSLDEYMDELKDFDISLVWRRAKI